MVGGSDARRAEEALLMALDGDEGQQPEGSNGSDSDSDSES